jgi:hypothetical protein
MEEKDHELKTWDESAFLQFYSIIHTDIMSFKMEYSTFFLQEGKILGKVLFSELWSIDALLDELLILQCHAKFG